MEHIKKDDIPNVIKNIKKHLKPGGLVIMSISTKSDVCEGVQLHQTRQNKFWWIKQFENSGFIYLKDVVKYFNRQFVRNDKGSFHLVLTLDKDKAPIVPKGKFVTKLLDLWFSSSLYRILKYILTGEYQL